MEGKFQCLSRLKLGRIERSSEACTERSAAGRHSSTGRQLVAGLERVLTTNRSRAVMWFKTDFFLKGVKINKLNAASSVRFTGHMNLLQSVLIRKSCHQPEVLLSTRDNK